MAASIYVEHSIYMDALLTESPELDLWRAIPILDTSYNNGYELCSKVYNDEIQQGKTPKIVHLFRHPFDQAISIFHNKSALKEVSESGGYFDALGEWRELNFKKLFRDVYLPLWVKMYLPYSVASRRDPNRVIVISFEELMKNPEQCFILMLAHANITLTRSQREVLAEAVRRTDRSEIQKIEDLHQTSFLDIVHPSAKLKKSWRHVRSGKSGQWHEALDQSDIAFGRHFLLDFGIKLEDLPSA